MHSVYLNLLAILHPQCKGCIMWSSPVTGAGVIGWRTAAKTQRYHQCLEHRGKSADTQKGASTLLSLPTIFTMYDYTSVSFKNFCSYTY